MPEVTDDDLKTAILIKCLIHADQSRMQVGKNLACTGRAVETKGRGGLNPWGQ
jgi:hypothetical protein